MRIQSTIIRNNVKEVPAAKHIKTIHLPGDTAVFQQQIEQTQEHIGTIADIAKLISDLGDQTGLSNKLDIDLQSVRDVSVFAKHMSKQELSIEQVLPGSLARTDVYWPSAESPTAGTLEGFKSGLSDIKLTIEECIIPGTKKADFNTAPRITLNLIDFAQKGIQFLETDPTAHPSNFLKNGLIANKALFDSFNTLVKLDGNVAPGVAQLVNYNAAALKGVQAWQSFSDENATPYRKIMDGLQACASSVELLAGSFSGWNKVKHSAGVSMIALDLVDKVVTLTIGKESTAGDRFIRSLS